MHLIRHFLLLVHLAGMAVLLGGFALAMMAGERRMTPAIIGGATFQLAGGLLLVAADHADHHHLNPAKIMTKLLVALVVTGLTHANRRRDPVPSGVFFGTFALAAGNVAIAYGWG